MSILALRDPFHDPFYALDAIDSMLSAPVAHNQRRRPAGNVETSYYSIRSEVLDTDTEFQVALEVPGITKENLDLTIENNVLAVKFNREKCEKTHESGAVVSSDFAYGPHVRRFKLPQNVNQDEVTSTFEHGVLRVKFAKQKKDGAPKKLTIQ